VSVGEVALLGGIAGVTIFLGLPVGRMRGLSTGVRVLLNAGAAGVLVFLLVETVEHAFEPVEEAVEESEWSEFAGRGAVFLVALAVGLLALVYYDRWLNRRRGRLSFGPGAATVDQFKTSGRIHALSEGKRLALFIALGIGLHNLAEGLAIGQSAANDEVNLAVLLVIGFAVHNATEGFGIVAPLTNEADRPSWAFLGVMGLIGGGPTFVGTLVGRSFTSEWADIAFLALAAGSILYVIVQLLGVAFKLGAKEMLMWGLFGGLVIGLGTELVLVAAGV